MNPTTNDQALLKEISKWKLEAADEDSQRFFYHLDDVQNLENGEYSIVIGRKGTGKTAICRYFETSSQHNRFSLKLSFKEFPFNLLYSLEDKNFTNPSQYISLWKYFIYNSVLKMMSTNHGINSEFRMKIDKLYPEDDFQYIGTLMQKWTKGSFGLGVFGVSGRASAEKEDVKIEEIWPDLIPAMERLIVNNIDHSQYFIVFDELDEDYRNYWDDKSRDRYISLITSLFKAVSNVRRVFSDNGCNIKPIIFLRDDIYELLSDPDKNKWEDHKINLAWKKDNLRRMIAFRIARSLDRDSNNFIFDEEWGKVVGTSTVGIGKNRGKNVHSFDYILSLTHSRPRDLVRFLRDAARSSVGQGHKLISGDTIRGVDGDFSTHFREELCNEIGGLIPDINNLLSHLGASHKQRYKYEDFIGYLEEYQESEDCDPQTRQLTPQAIAKILFHFSIIGNAQKPHNRPIFKYQRNHLAINTNEPLVVHRGLVKTLGLR
ncbi:P-loop ATPase, Sll1717 family [Leisingera sp. ANG-Vp]|uniref:P-loop ATPase, Sll1717 family n=1 Tax=Leisingera sp. ANG-Vp TaxID=1577896 RepID=UPI00057E5D58|nr:hypothetical protein [Leisingera sp. ANG-Vp]KIC14753.1 hypothetical protein RA20_19730 [Leisingera sp. ANG-Vp]